MDCFVASLLAMTAKLKESKEKKNGKTFTRLDRHGTDGLSDGRAPAEGGQLGRDLESHPRQGRAAREKGRPDRRSAQRVVRSRHRVHDGVGGEGSRAGLFRAQWRSRLGLRS